MKHLLNLTVLILSVVSLSATAQHTQHTQAVPPGCVAHVIFLPTVSGSPSYLRLRYEIEALGSAQEGVSSMGDALKEFNAATTATAGLSALITGTTDAVNALHCSAYIMGNKYKPTDADDRVIAGLMVQGFNQEADALVWLQGDTKRSILRAVGEDHTKAEIGKSAEARSAMEAKQNDAAESLMLAVTQSLLLSVDLSNMQAKDTVKTVLSCGEFKDLQEKSTAIMGEEKSAYRNSASLVVEFLKGHECVAR